MSESVEPIKLRAAAEHLEWVLNQYPDSDDLQSLLRALAPLMEDVKAGRVVASVVSADVPGSWNFGDGRYMSYENPNVDAAYSAFADEMGGGRSDEQNESIAELDAMWKAIDGSFAT